MGNAWEVSYYTQMGTDRWGWVEAHRGESLLRVIRAVWRMRRNGIDVIRIEWRP